MTAWERSTRWNEAPVDPLLDQVMTWITESVPVETIAIRIRRRVPDQPSRVRVVKELRRRARAFWVARRWGPAQHLERVVEAMERPPSA